MLALRLAAAKCSLLLPGKVEYFFSFPCLLVYPAFFHNTSTPTLIVNINELSRQDFYDKIFDGKYLPKDNKSEYFSNIENLMQQYYAELDAAGTKYNNTAKDSLFSLLNREKLRK